ncbi:hypothetical protein NGRA_0790 [Nosema granulosis]|uniref:Uncharacterized protein n=1 Tax=Nosema granulosis TaxID=83296 RepID=A0A9P6H0Q5_9MICR|nr:hypothetical protein NGRA_0790 [Nosema granulosis]
MIIYKNLFMIRDVSIKGLLFPKIYTVHLSNNESMISLMMHRSQLYVEGVTCLEILISNHYEETPQGLLTLNGKIYKIDEYEEAFQIFVLYYGLETIITLPIKFRSAFEVRKPVSILLFKGEEVKL